MNIYYIGNIPFSNELYHHGIKGQKWGVRRFQNPDGTLTAEGRARYGTVENLNKAMAVSSSSKSTPYKVDHHANDGNKEELAKLALTTAVSLVNMNPLGIVDAGKRFAEAGISKAKASMYFKNREKNGIIDKKTGLYKKNREMSEQQDLSKVNPEFKSFNSNSKNNCMLCTTTYDLRRRGFDVTANKASIGYWQDDVSKWYPKAKLESHSSVGPKGKYSNKTMRENVRKNLAKQGPGARGNIMVKWSKSYGGHSMVYEVGKNGRVRILDGQSGKIYSNPDRILKRCNSVTTARLDNVEPDWKKVKECCR